MKYASDQRHESDNERLTTTGSRGQPEIGKHLVTDGRLLNRNGWTERGTGLINDQDRNREWNWLDLKYHKRSSSSFSSCLVENIKWCIDVSKESGFKGCECTGLITVKRSQRPWMWPFFSAKIMIFCFMQMYMVNLHLKSAAVLSGDRGMITRWLCDMGGQWWSPVGRTVLKRNIVKA